MTLLDVIDLDDFFTMNCIGLNKFFTPWGKRNRVLV